MDRRFTKVVRVECDAPFCLDKRELSMPTCPDRQQLIVEWRDAVLKFSDNVKRLAQCTKNGDGFMDQFQATDLARQHAENSHRMLSQHRAEHGC
jgi:hypothetical protein